MKPRLLLKQHISFVNSNFGILSSKASTKSLGSHLSRENVSMVSHFAPWDSGCLVWVVQCRVVAYYGPGLTNVLQVANRQKDREGFLTVFGRYNWNQCRYCRDTNVQVGNVAEASYWRAARHTFLTLLKLCSMSKSSQGEKMTKDVGPLWILRLMEIILHHLGCPKRSWYEDKTNISGILSSARFFLPTVSPHPPTALQALWALVLMALELQSGKMKAHEIQLYFQMRYSTEMDSD